MPRPIAIAAVLFACALAGCGGDDEPAAESTRAPAEQTQAPTEDAPQDAPVGGAVRVESPADGALEFTQPEYKAEAGTVEIEYANPSQVGHAVEVEGTASDVITEGSAKISVELQPGTYELICPVGSHAAAGMTAQLTVQ